MLDLYAGTGAASHHLAVGRDVIAVDKDGSVASAYRKRIGRAKMIVGHAIKAVPEIQAESPPSVVVIDSSGAPFDALYSVLRRFEFRQPALIMLTWGYINDQIHNAMTRETALRTMYGRIRSATATRGMEARRLAEAWPETSQGRPIIYGAYSVVRRGGPHLAAVEKARRKHSREYLEEALTAAKKTLPWWQWAVLSQSAKSRAGGRVRHRKPEGPTEFEKVALRDITPRRLREFPEAEVRLAWLRLNQWYATAVREKQPTEDIVNAAVWTISELKRRGIEVNEDNELAQTAAQLSGKSAGAMAGLGRLPRELMVVQDFISVVGSTAKGSKDATDIDVLVRSPKRGEIDVDPQNIWLPIRNTLDPDKRDRLHWIYNAQGPHGDHVPLYDLVLRRKDDPAVEIVKRFPNGIAEVGVHVHNLERENKRTKQDGTHQHLFVFDDDISVLSEIDGEHVHEFGSATSDAVVFGGEHIHIVRPPPEMERKHGKLVVERDGLHRHELQGWSSAFDGIHTHSLVDSEGGVVARTLTSGEYWEHRGRPPQADVPLAPSAQELAKDTEISTAVDKGLRLDLGCGNSRPAGYLGIDKQNGEQVDRLHDLEQGIPFPDGSCREVRAYHVLEHLTDKEAVMAEIHRVLMPGGTLSFEVPSTKGDGAFAHPDHKSFWNKSSIAFWTQDNLREDRPAFGVEELEEIRSGDLHYVRGVLRKPTASKAELSKAISPFKTFEPPKPRVSGFTELFEVNEIWDWAKDRLPVAVEPKHNGFRCIAERRDDDIRLWFEGQPGVDQLSKVPSVKSALKRIPGEWVLDCDIGLERGGKRLPRPDLAVLNQRRPDLGTARPVVTVFDVPFLDEDLSAKPFDDRRATLENLTTHFREPTLRVSPLRWVDKKDELEQAARWAFGMERSEGLVAKSSRGEYKPGATNEWSKLKRVAELKALVLRSQRNRDGTWSYHGGLRPDGDRHDTIQFRDKPFVDLGRSLNTSIAARPGDIITVEILELIPKDRDLAWLGARVQDVDRSRTTPFGVNQALDISRRAQVLQKDLSSVPMVGPERAKVAFIAASPGEVEAARKEALVGPSGETFKQQYLDPLELTREEIALGYAVPILRLDDNSRIRQPAVSEVERWHEQLHKDLDQLAPTVVVALGGVAAKALGDRVDFTLPHPARIRKFGDNGELTRKIGQLKDVLSHDSIWSICDDHRIEPVKKNDVLVLKQPERGEGGGETKAFRAFDVWEKTWQEQLPKSGKGRWVYQHHWRGLDPERDETELTDDELLKTDRSLHGDLRLEGDDALWGWAVLIGMASDNLKVSGDKLLALKPGQKGPEGTIGAANKLPQPKLWLDVGRDKPLVSEPGGVGATTMKAAKFFARDWGTYELGVVRQHSVELFLKSQKLDKAGLTGRYLLQFAPVAGGRRVWQLKRPADQTPLAERRDLQDVIRDVRRRRQRFLVWSKPGEKPRLIDVRTGREVKAAQVSIVKADEAKQIVYGVVLDPYQVDAHNDWIPPAEIERTAHEWFKQSRLISLRHRGTTSSHAVESWVEPYPSRSDYQKAMRGEPHRVYRRKFGDDWIHSGAWLVGSKLNNTDWSDHRKGDLDAYSIEGFAVKRRTTTARMPSVSFVTVDTRSAA